MSYLAAPYQRAISIPLAAIAGVLVLPAFQDAEQAVPAPLTPVNRPSPYEAGNAGTVIRFDTGLTGDLVVDHYRPRTDLGVKLLALRRAYIENGGALLDDAAFEAELRGRRGGVDAQAHLS